MPFLGGSEREWSSVIAALGNKFRCAGVAMPGFGSAADVLGYSVTEMVDYLATAVHDLKLGPFVLVGHSMSGRVPAVAALRRHEGDEAFQHLRGLILVASSPPSPEPIIDSRLSSLMSHDAAEGVVDPYGRSFDVSNLWICDNSVFPSALPANPALTIMALSLRTADRFLSWVKAPRAVFEGHS